MSIDTTITIDTALNTGLALLGYFYIMFCAGRWLSLLLLKKWNKCRKQDQRQKAMNAFSEAFGIDSMEPGDPARGNDSNLLIVFYVQIMPDDFVMQLHRF
ncbi:TPA: DUF4752 family protein [Escherichia coli]